MLKSGQKRAVTLAEIARRIGVSSAAISSVLNGRAVERRISAATVARIETAVRKAGYVPNIAARRLRATVQGTSYATIAIITTYEAPLLLVSRAASALQRQIAALGDSSTRFSVTIEMYAAGSLASLHGISDTQHFSGAIIANTIHEDDEFLATAKLPFPVVVIDRRIPGYTSVLESSETGSRAAELLLAAGCVTPAILLPGLGTEALGIRAQHFARAQIAHGHSDIISIVCRDRSEAAGYEAMKKHLASRHVADGVFATTDSLAIGAYHAIHKSGRTIPRDINVVGVGDFFSSPYLNPPLTCVGSSQDEVHATAARLLLDRYHGRLNAPVQVVIPLQVAVRSSVRRPTGTVATE